MSIGSRFSTNFVYTEVSEFNLFQLNSLQLHWFVSIQVGFG